MKPYALYFYTAVIRIEENTRRRQCHIHSRRATGNEIALISGLNTEDASTNEDYPCLFMQEASLVCTKRKTKYMSNTCERKRPLNYRKVTKTIVREVKAGNISIMNQG